MDLLQTVRKEGSRGGRAEFKWDDVKNDHQRENYLGHSLMAPVGRWQKGKDLNWYARAEGDQEGKSEAELRKEEMRRVKEAEEEAMAKALGYELPPKKAENPNEVALGERKSVQETVRESLGDVNGIEGRKSEARRDRDRDRDREHKRRHRRSRSRDRRDKERDGERRHRHHGRRDRSRSASRSRSRSRNRHRHDGHRDRDYGRREDRGYDREAGRDRHADGERSERRRDRERDYDRERDRRSHHGPRRTQEYHDDNYYRRRRWSESRSRSRSPRGS